MIAIKIKILLRIFPIVFFIAVLAGCKESSFKGNTSKKEPAQEKVADVKASPTPAPAPSNGPVPPPAPPGAITKGSFTVWTVPKDPQPKQDYEIHIEVKLPSNTANYQEADLSGTVNGTDKYFREIGPNAKPVEQLFPLWPKDKFNVTGPSAILVMTIPGAEVLVQDTIKVRSQILNEEQEIAIVF